MTVWNVFFYAKRRLFNLISCMYLVTLKGYKNCIFWILKHKKALEIYGTYFEVSKTPWKNVSRATVLYIKIRSIVYEAKIFIFLSNICSFNYILLMNLGWFRQTVFLHSSLRHFVHSVSKKSDSTVNITYTTLDNNQWSCCLARRSYRA